MSETTTKRLYVPSSWYPHSWTRDSGNLQRSRRQQTWSSIYIFLPSKLRTWRFVLIKYRAKRWTALQCPPRKSPSCFASEQSANSMFGRVPTMRYIRDPLAYLNGTSQHYPISLVPSYLTSRSVLLPFRSFVWKWSNILSTYQDCVSVIGFRALSLWVSRSNDMQDSSRCFISRQVKSRFLANYRSFLVLFAIRVSATTQSKNDHTVSFQEILHSVISKILLHT